MRGALQGRNGTQTTRGALQGLNHDRDILFTDKLLFFHVFEEVCTITLVPQCSHNTNNTHSELPPCEKEKTSYKTKCMRKENITKLQLFLNVSTCQTA